MRSSDHAACSFEVLGEWQVQGGLWSKMCKTRGALARLVTLIGSMVWVMTLANCGSLTMNPASTVADDTPPQSSTVDPPGDTTPPQPADTGDDADALTFHVSRGLCCDRLTYRFDADISETSISDDATFSWSFGDNRTKTGIRVEHTYNWSLDYVVTLTVQTPDNEVYEVARILLLSLGDEPQTVAVPDTPTDTNSPPTASDQTVSIDAEDELALTLTGSDADGDDLTFWIVTGPEHGTLGAIDNTGVSTATTYYTPDPGFAGTDSFTFRVTDGLEDSQMATVMILPCETLKVIPWVELNYSVFDEQVIEGLLIWQNVADTAIITTRPGRADLYTKLRERLPEMRIIPGLKSMHLLDRFDSVEGWRSIAQEIAAIRDASGEQVFLLENEVALHDWVMGMETLDMDLLAEALATLPTDVQYLWRPSVYWFIAGDEGVERLAQVCRVAEDVLEDVRFVDQRFNARVNVNSQVYTAAQTLLESITSKSTPTLQYYYGPDYELEWWKDNEVLDALSYVRQDRGSGAEVLIYPGIERWVEAAAALTGQLVPACSPSVP